MLWQKIHITLYLFAATILRLRKISTSNSNQKTLSQRAYVLPSFGWTYALVICKTHTPTPTHQAEESSLDAQCDDLKKQGTMLEHHLSGTVNAKKRFEAMVGG